MRIAHLYKETHHFTAIQLGLDERAAPDSAWSQLRQFLKSEHELLIVIIQEQPPFTENLLCTSNEAKSFKVMITLNPHNNSMSYAPQFVNGNQVANQIQQSSEPLGHFYYDPSYILSLGRASTSGVQASRYDTEPKGLLRVLLSSIHLEIG